MTVLLFYSSKKGNHNISALFEDKDKKLWVGTDRGVYLYDMMLDTFTALDDKAESGASLDNWVSNIVADSVGNIWVVIPDQGVFRYAGKKLYFYEKSGWEPGARAYSVMTQQKINSSSTRQIKTIIL